MAGQIISRGKDVYLVRAYAGRNALGKRRYINQTIHGPKKAAQQWLTKTLRDRDTGMFVQPSRESVALYLSRWLHDVAPPVLRSRTHRDYTYYVGKYIVPVIGNRRLDRLSSADVQELCGGMTNRGLTARTVRFCHAVLRCALNHAVDGGLLARNPAKRVKLPKKVRAEMKCLSASEAQRFLAASENDEWAALWVLLLTTGLRPGEAFGLKWADLDGDRVRVQHALVPGYKGTWEIQPPKTKSSIRSVPLPPSALRALARHRARQAEDRLRTGPAYRDNGFIFADAIGEPLNAASLSKRPFQRVLKAAGLDHMRMYDLRHSCATLLLSSGINVKVVSERLGHSSVALTLDTYAHVLPDMQQAATERLERVLFG